MTRHACQKVETLLGTFPLVAVTGARQVGKSTLARQVLGSLDGTYMTLDDPVVLNRATEDPLGFVRRDKGLLVIDEIQLTPELLPVIKAEIDRDRRPGRFLITGSANLLKMRSVTESLAGRSAWFELPPLLWSEIVGRPLPTPIDAAFDASGADSFLHELGRPLDDHAEAARKRAILGGMPEPLRLGSEMRRAWHDAYRQTFVERDLRQLSRIENLPDFRRLSTLALLQTSRLLTLADLASDAGLNHATARRYLNILEVAYQVFELSPYFANVGKRLVRRPKLYANDVGMAAHVANVDSWEAAESTVKAGPLFETWVVNELRALDEYSSRRASVHYWRTSAGAEVDLVFERGTDVVAVEVKSSATVHWKETRGMRALREDLGKRFRLGIVAYLGDEPQVLDETLCMVPVASLLGATQEE
ncbi:MAG: ATP-binding protein [Coriobacteriia bacterium]|nr:ATP-binding protein [Coriobacteriia bacterium]